VRGDEASSARSGVWPTARWIGGCGIAAVVLGAAVWSMWLPGDSPQSLTVVAEDLERDGAVPQAFERAVDALAGASARNVGSVWILQRLHRTFRDQRLGDFIGRGVEDLHANDAISLIDPRAAKVHLPEHPGRGFERFATYVLAPLGLPETRAIEFLTAFLADDERGYVQTHQLLGLEWAKEAGLDLPDLLLGRIPILLARITVEQNADPSFSDLFAERAAILLAFASPSRADAARWVAIILGAQEADGSWVDAQGVALAYDGAHATTRHPRPHTTAFAAAALGFYLDRS